MRFGVGIFATEYTISPVELAQAAEERRLESFWVPEHTHIPVAEVHFPNGAEVPDMYRHSLDPFVALSAVAACTTTIRVGTGICLVVERDPIITAKEVASLDVLSGGRFLFGVGGGWNRTEMRNHGTDPRVRFAVLEERLEAMRAIWAEETPEYHGVHVDFDPIHAWPKPVQRPHPPILIGGNGPGTLRRVVAQGDEWMPNAFGADRFGERILELQRLAEDAGRDPIPVTAFGCRPDLTGVERYAEIGVDRCVFWMPSVGRDEALAVLDRYAAVVEEYGDVEVPS